MSSECQTLKILMAEHVILDGEQREKYGDNCCSYETCCEGEYCGLECCNDQGNQTFGNCNCQTEPKIRSADDHEKMLKSENALSDHKLKCKKCNKGASSTAYTSEDEEK